MTLLRKATLLGLATISVLSLSLPGTYAHDVKGVIDCEFRHVCVWEHEEFQGVKQQISGFSPYTDLNGALHDRASSWTNANGVTTECLGDWRSSWYSRKAVALSYLKAGWSGTNLQDDIHYDGTDSNDQADFVARWDWSGWNGKPRYSRD